MASPRILVVRPDRIGDVVLSLPVLQALRRRWPDAYLAMMVHPYTRDILADNPWIDGVLTDAPDASDRGVIGFLRQVRRLREDQFDTALMLMPAMRATWMLFLAGIPRRIGVGHKLYQTLTFTRSVSRNRYIPLRHEADYCLDLAREIGAEATEIHPEVFLTDMERRTIRAILESEGVDKRPVIGIHPGNGYNAPNWSPEQYGALAEQLFKDYNVPALVTGSTEEQDLIDRMAASTVAPVISLAGRLTLRNLMAVIGEMDILISSSTGPMHLAAAMNVPTVSLFCPLPGRSPERWAPLSEHKRIYLPADGQCETCEKGPMCTLSGITVETVSEGVAELLNEKGTTGNRCSP
ncbi:MAG: glycosyltransferase family 9 protein [Gemmatimonadota bacterium]|nr:glycosyltransferase family 9 protein [Gemmatimonadota bacterium]